jgi:hypothetical protein
VEKIFVFSMEVGHEARWNAGLECESVCDVFLEDVGEGGGGSGEDEEDIPAVAIQLDRVWGIGREGGVVDFGREDLLDIFSKELGG